LLLDFQVLNFNVILDSNLCSTYMIALIRKEINAFFSSIVAYIVISVFLTTTGLFLWIFPGEFNIPESGYAGLEPLFYLAPWVLLFLIPAVTMRSFAEEQKAGTLDLLLTKPISNLQIILAKFLSSLALVLISIAPTLIYYYSIIQLGEPQGNIDHAATWGSYIGLIFLSAVYVSIGIFTSVLTDNQVISFIAALMLTFLLFVGFDSISEINSFSNIGVVIRNLGINEHYKSMSRGVIDTRDIVYFLAVISIFITLTKWFLSNKAR
jgi:ABC-2 type transport system permease protein